MYGPMNAVFPLLSPFPAPLRANFSRTISIVAESGDKVNLVAQGATSQQDSREKLP